VVQWCPYTGFGDGVRNWVENNSRASSEVLGT
jgi:hypothetical protein